MKYAIRFYNDIPNPEGIPGAVIYESLLVPDNTLTPPTGYSTLMTDSEMSDYISAHAADYEQKNQILLANKVAQSERKLRRDGISDRIKWGREVVLDFRDYAVAKNINAQDSVALMNVLGSILPYLQLGLLGPAAYLLGLVGENSFLDGEMDGASIGVTLAVGTTVKQYFIARILEGNI